MLHPCLCHGRAGVHRSARGSCSRGSGWPAVFPCSWPAAVSPCPGRSHTLRDCLVTPGSAIRPSGVVLRHDLSRYRTRIRLPYGEPESEAGGNMRLEPVVLIDTARHSKTLISEHMAPKRTRCDSNGILPTVCGSNNFIRPKVGRCPPLHQRDQGATTTSDRDKTLSSRLPAEQAWAARKREALSALVADAGEHLT